MTHRIAEIRQRQSEGRASLTCAGCDLRLVESTPEALEIAWRAHLRAEGISSRDRRSGNGRGQPFSIRVGEAWRRRRN
jgi:hypothetical protein